MQRLNHPFAAILGIAVLIASGCSQEQKVAQNGAVETEKQSTESKETNKEVVPTTTVSSQSADQDSKESETTTQAVINQRQSTSARKSAKTEPSVQKSKRSAVPVTVLEATKALDLSTFKKPRGAKNSYVFQTSMHYDISADMDKALIQVADELLKRGFIEKDSQRTRMGTITINIDDRPMSIFLANSWGGDLTHVTMYNHQGIDVSSVPMLKASSSIDKRVDRVYYQTAIGVREGHHNLRAEIGKQGIDIARMRTGNGIAKVFEKDGVKVVVQAEESEQTEFEYPDNGRDGKSTGVAIFNRGNVDVAKLPRPADFEQTKQAYTTIFGSAKFFTNSGAMDAVQRAEKELQSAGWSKVDPIREGISDVQRLMMKNGTLVQIQATEFGENRSHVDYSLSLLPFDIPGDIETRIVRVDTAAPHMFFSTTSDVKTLRDFYTKHLEAIGWKSDQSNQISTEDRFALLYHVSYHQPVALEIESKGEGSTWVEVRPVSFEDLAKIFRKATPKDVAKSDRIESNEEEVPSEMQQIKDVASALSNVDVPDSSEQIKALAQKQMEEALKNVPADQAEEIKKMMEQQLAGMFEEQEPDAGTAEETDETFASATESAVETNNDQPKKTVPEGKIAAEDFPIPDGAQNVTRDFEMITFGVTEIKKNAKFITEKLTALDWKTRGEQIIDDDLAMLRFQKGVGTINFSMTFDDRRDPPVHAVAHGDGIWFPDSDMFAGEPYEGELEDGDFTGEPGFDEFEAKDFEGMPLPEGIESPIQMRSQFRSEFVTSVEGDIEKVHEFFHKSAATTDWKIQSDSLNAEDSTINMSSERGELSVDLKKFEGEIEITLAFRDPKVAKEKGFVPPAGKARLFLANMEKAEMTIVINGKSHKLAPEQGAEDPMDSVRVDVAPGEYKYSIQGEGREVQSDKLKVVAGGSWGIVVFPEQGHMAERMY